MQPYVSPIKLYTESEDSDECAVTNSNENEKRKKCLGFKKNRKSSQQMVILLDQFNLYKFLRYCIFCYQNVLAILLQINSSVRKTFVSRRSGGNCCSDNLWRHCSKYSVGSVQNERKHGRASEPWREIQRHSSVSSDSFWPQELKSDGRAISCHCCCHKKVLNPMLKLVRYLDDMLKSDIHDFVDR